MKTFDYDYVIVGSGFGGAVSAMRLAERGWRVGVGSRGTRPRALFVVDGASIPANIGVNPGLTVAAMAERFAAPLPDNLVAAAR